MTDDANDGRSESGARSATAPPARGEGEVPRLDELLDLAFDFVLSRPLRELVDPDRLLAALDELTPMRLARWQERLVTPLRKRVLARAAKSGVKLGAWLPPEAVEKFSAMLGAPRPLPRDLVDDLVSSQRVRDEVRTILTETLTSFVAKSTSAMPLGGLLGRGARAASAMGKGLLGGLGDELQKQLEQRVRDFVDGSVALLQQRIARALTSPETSRALGARLRRGFLALLERTEADAAKLGNNARWDELEPLFPKLVRHNLNRAEFREALVAEVRAQLEELSKQSLGDALVEAGLRDAAREALHRHGLPLARDFAKTAGAQAWLAKLPR